MRKHSSFTYHITELAIYVIDKNGPMSVTNDAEAVVEHVFHAAGDLGNLPIFYRDSEGEWGQLCHEGYIFTGFGFNIADCYREEINRL